MQYSVLTKKTLLGLYAEKEEYTIPDGVTAIAEGAFEAIENLTPGDFRTVRQSLYYLDEVSNAARLSALEQESRVKKSPAKQENRNGKIGF